MLGSLRAILLPGEDLTTTVSCSVMCAVSSGFTADVVIAGSSDPMTAVSKSRMRFNSSYDWRGFHTEEYVPPNYSFLLVTRFAMLTNVDGDASTALSTLDGGKIIMRVGARQNWAV